MPNRVGVGVGIVVTNDDAVLLVQRKFHGAGSWSTPGGYLDPGETPESTALRELREETGVTATDPTVVGISNDIHPDGKHNVTFWITARYVSGTGKLTAPDELNAVAWFPWSALPESIYLSFQNYLDGRIYGISNAMSST